jgi:hypothetical protein
MEQRSRRDQGRAGRRLCEPDGLPEPTVQERQQRPDVEAGGPGHHARLGAWDRAQSELSRNQTFQQQQAQNSAFGQGLQAGNTAFGMNLSAGQFANSAQQQGFDQAATNAGLANHAADQHTAVSLANAQMANQQGQFNASLNNAAHAQGMTDTFALYNQPLNTYNQLQTGAQARSRRLLACRAQTWRRPTWPGSSTTATPTRWAPTTGRCRALASSAAQQ